MSLSNAEVDQATRLLLDHVDIMNDELMDLMDGMSKNDEELEAMEIAVYTIRRALRRIRRQWRCEL